MKKHNWQEIQKFCDEKERSWRDIRDHFGVLNGSIANAVIKGKLVVSDKRNKNRGKVSFDVNEAQKYYDEGHTWVEVAKHVGSSESTITRACSWDLLKARTRSEAGKLSQKRKPRNHSEETKKKISKARIKFLKENPDKVPYLLNHYSKGMSYPEKYFEKLFRNEKIELTYHHRIGLYQLDFADVERKLDIEIDGNQHNFDPRIVKSDIRRTNWLVSRGWKVYRICWSFWQRKTREEKEEAVLEIRDFLK